MNNFFYKILTFLKFITKPINIIIKKLMESHDKSLEKKIKREIEVSLTHELRTPLTSIMAYSEMLIDNLKNDPENLKYSIIINKKSKELLRLIDNMLTMFILDFNPQAYPFETINLSNIAMDTCNEFKKLYESNNSYILNINIQQNIMIYGNDRLLKKIIFELLINSYLYSKKNQKLIITLSIHKLDNIIEIFVQDNGIGIKEKYQKRVFDRFFRIENIEYSNSPGLGIGLTLVKKIVELLNGNIELQSKENVGTIVIITIPTQNY